MPIKDKQFYLSFSDNRMHLREKDMDIDQMSTATERQKE